MWFLPAVAVWLDMALLRAVRRIMRAVALDDLRDTVDELVAHTPSAVDAGTVFGQIQVFWAQLDWPDPETSYVFISRYYNQLSQLVRKTPIPLNSTKPV